MTVTRDRRDIWSVTNGVSHGVSHSPPTRPVPSRPNYLHNGCTQPPDVQPVPDPVDNPTRRATGKGGQ